MWFCAPCHGGGWTHGDWRLGKDVTTLWKDETVLAQRCLWRSISFVSTFVCDRLYHGMTVTHWSALALHLLDSCWMFFVIFFRPDLEKKSDT